NTTPLSIGANAGDSGSPVFAWDDIEQQWKLVAVHVGYDQEPASPVCQGNRVVSGIKASISAAFKAGKPYETKKLTAINAF
ncbi:S6 family peptidase, partial [Pantoea agglomerans]|uniref:S6 family peptidase n=1 Tax=Enterobacter agglomerans TaxID=549 RepID=UPI001A8D92CB